MSADSEESNDDEFSNFSDGTPRKRPMRKDKTSDKATKKCNKIYVIHVTRDTIIKNHIDLVIVGSIIPCTITLPLLTNNNPTNNITYKSHRISFSVTGSDVSHKIVVASKTNKIDTPTGTTDHLKLDGRIDLVPIGNTWYYL